jgi:phosphopantothenoylcysteine decarboxylase/phosphopantothenate--cysteine ligase
MQGKKVLIGITGSIAAYKIPLLVRLLKKAGAEVQIVLTPAAKDFVTPLTLSVLSGNPVYSIPFDIHDGKWNSHVEFAQWADLMVIAPVSANTLGKMVNGIADNLLITTYLSARSHVMIAPAMDLDMYQHPSTKRNIEILRSYGHQIIEPTEGELASGLCGAGRMEEPEEIFKVIEDFFKKKNSLANKNFLITAGPTFEAIDPVRFIGNHSSGKMGFELAKEIAQRGGKVSLICGPTAEKIDHPNIQRFDVVSAKQMFEKCRELFPHFHITIMAAAIADFTPKFVSDKKIKKLQEIPVIELIPTQDILKYLGENKTENQILVGFALETDQEEINAKKKLESKNLDFIVLNSLKDEGAGFGFLTNKISIINKKNEKTSFELKSKKLVANDIINYLEDYLKN